MAKLCMFADLLTGDGLLNWDDLDFDELCKEKEEKDKLKLIFEPEQSTEPFSSDLFILLEGNVFVDIVNQAQNVEKLCTISAEYGLKNQSALYKNKNILIAAIDTDSRDSAEVVELLRPYAEKAKRVVTISTKSMVDYRESAADSRHDVTFIRGINSRLNYIMELEAPNMICGVAAGIASWRSFKQLPVECYVFFVRQALLDEDSAKKVLKLLQELGSGDTFEYKLKRRQPSSLFL